MPSIFSDNFPSVYAPEMGIKYLDANNQTQWAMIGYFDQTGVPITYDLHFINSENNGECNPMERDLDFKNMPVKQIETLYAIFPVTTFDMHIQRFVLDFDSNKLQLNCLNLQYLQIPGSL